MEVSMARKGRGLAPGTCLSRFHLYWDNRVI
jgi:hypothetical protein